MKDVLEAVKCLDVHEQRQLLVDLLLSHPPITQLSLLVPVLTAAPGYVKWRASCLLSSHDTPDLLMLLPPELQLAILSFVDGHTLLQASLVSHGWHSLIKSHQKQWLEKCRRMGMNLTASMAYCSPGQPLDWQQVYVAMARQENALKSGQAFTHRSLHLNNCRKPIKAVDYRDGYLCTVSEEDQVTIWHLGLNVAVLTFPCERVVSCLCLHPKSLLLCGHFTGTLSSWDLAAMPRPTQNIKNPASSDDPGSSFSPNHCFSSTSRTSQSQAGILKTKFKMHGGPVFSCDFSDDLDLLVSGGADESLKLWCLSSGFLLHSLAIRTHWVIFVKLLPASDTSVSFSSFPSGSDSASKETSRHKVLYMTRERVAKISWPATCKEQNMDLKAEANKHSDKLSSMKNNSNRTSVNSANLSAKTEKESDDTSQKIPRKIMFGNLIELSEDGGIDLSYGEEFLFTPGLQITRKYIALVQQDVEGKNNRLHLIDVETMAYKHSLLLGFKVKKLLALGNRYALLLTPGSALYSSTLTVLDVVTGDVAGSCTVPHSKMTTPDGAQIVVGDVDWLDGLGPHLPQPPLAPEPETKRKFKPCVSCTAEQVHYENKNPTHIVCNHRPHFTNPDSSPEQFFSWRQQCELEEKKSEDGEIDCKQAKAGFLVLAAGVQTEPGKLFTLWWAEAGQEYKCKKD